MKYLTAGESHGKGLTAILEGFPSGVPIDCAALDLELRRRQLGYGRGGRMKIETDGMEITAGLIGSRTIGSPIAFFIRNRDFEKWRAYTDPVTGDAGGKKLTAVRPGHADLTGAIKYGFTDARPVLERASARETAARVGVGAFCKQLLALLGVSVESCVTEICGVKSAPRIVPAGQINAAADSNPVRCLDSEASKKMIEAIDACRESGDTAGGEVEIVVSGLPAGVGSYAHYDRKLDAVLSLHLGSIQAVKSVGFGLGHGVASVCGSAVHDEIFYEGGKIVRKTNRAGGVEGGMSNGEDIIIRVAVKPIPTLMRGLATVDIATHEPTAAHPERSDVCAVPAAGVVAENVAAYAILDELLRVTGGDDFVTVERRVKELRERAKI